MGQHLDTSIIHIKANFCHVESTWKVSIYIFVGPSLV